MKLADEKKPQLKKIKPPKTKHKKKEQLSTKDIEQLMGVYKDVYTRRNGAVRRK